MNGPRISEGNSKLGGIPNVSLPPVKTCANCSECRKDCYALKSWRQYKNVRDAWGANYALVSKAPAVYFGGIQAYCKSWRPKFFRWHVAGDILGQGYLDLMSATARACPDTRFLCFTKRHDLDYSGIPENLRIRFSLWPGMVDPGPGIPRAWMQDGTETRIPKGATKCPGSCEKCKACFNSTRDVYFLKH